MDKKRKIVGTLAVLVIVVSIVMVSVPAEKDDKNINKNDWGCSCNEAPTQGKPLNYYDILEKTKGWEQDVALLEKEIKKKKEMLLGLYKEAKEGIQWKELEDLQSEIEELEREYWYKKEVLFEMSVIRKYTELQSDGTLKIVRESLPEIDDFEVGKALNTMEFVGEEKMRKESELCELIFGKNYENKYWNEMGKEYVEVPDLDTKKLETIYREIENLEDEHWQYKKRHIELRTIQKIKEDIANGRTTLSGCYGFWCDPPTTPLDDYGYYIFYNFQKVKVWVGMYDKSSPFDPNADMIDEYCTTYFTTSMTYYWNLAKNRNPNTKSIQIKWFYLADVYDDGTRHNIIWEGNKNSSREWYTYYGKYTTTNPKSGSYQVKRYLNHHACCGWIKCHWCNTHCGGCFACDPSRAQYFSRTDTKS